MKIHQSQNNMMCLRLIPLIMDKFIPIPAGKFFSFSFRMLKQADIILGRKPYPLPLSQCNFKWKIRKSVGQWMRTGIPGIQLRSSCWCFQVVLRCQSTSCQHGCARLRGMGVEAERHKHDCGYWEWKVLQPPSSPKGWQLIPVLNSERRRAWRGISLHYFL